MRVRFLGTAAADGYPNPFCACDNCQQARVSGGKSLRRRSALLINDDLLLDLGLDVIAATQAQRLDLTRLQYCLQTHEHEDHLHPALFLAHSPAPGVPDAPRLHFYAAALVIDLDPADAEQGGAADRRWNERGAEPHAPRHRAVPALRRRAVSGHGAPRRPRFRTRPAPLPHRAGRALPFLCDRYRPAPRGDVGGVAALGSPRSSASTWRS